MIDKKLNIQYTCLQISYYATVVCCVLYIVPVLQMQGFNSVLIGALLGLRALLSVIFQPFFAGLIAKYPQLPFNYFIAAMIVASMGATFWQLLRPNTLGMILIFVLYGIFTFGMASFIDAMSTLYLFQNKKVNYPIARAAGSFSLAIVSLIVGKLTTAESILLVQLILFVPLLILMLTITKITAEPSAKKHRTLSTWQLLQQYPVFVIFLLATIFSFVGNNMSSNFLIDVYRSLGADNQAYGIGWFVLALSEIPAALIFNKLLQKVGVDRLLLISFFFTALRIFLILTAINVPALIAVQLFQMLGNGLFYAGNIQFILKYLPADCTVKAQAIVGACYQGIGSGLGSLLSGLILGMTNLTTLLLISTVLSLLGVLIWGIGKSLTEKNIVVHDAAR